MKHYEDAVRDLTRCVAQYPADVPASVTSRFNLARAYAEMGREAEASEQLARALSLQRDIGGLTASNLAEAERLLAQLTKAD